MLSPDDRSTLLEALRPPDGFALDGAAGTSFTLDLEALLTAPVAFALYAASDTDQEAPDIEPVSLLDAIRRHAGRITLFSQAGQISVPARRRTVFAWLEESVVPVRASRAERIFHPKVWLVRYTETDGDRAVLRVLCATRNLTFDTSWDTLLRMESAPYVPGQHGEAVPAQTELAALFRTLPNLAIEKPSRERVRFIHELACDLEHVPLVPPEPYDGVRFHVLGLGPAKPLPFPSRGDRAAVVSPFLSESFLRPLTEDHDVTLLLSRTESLDRIPHELLGRVARVTVLTSALDDRPETEEASAASEQGDPGTRLGGLHAKLFVFDTGGSTSVFTGSANATGAAFDGNVEVLVELTGPRSGGLESLLAENPDENGFVRLLADYRPLEETVEPDETERLQRELDRERAKLASLRFTVKVVRAEEDYLLQISSEEPVPEFGVDLFELFLWPATLDEGASVRPLEPGSRARASFRVTNEGITAFLALRAIARRGAASAQTSFIVIARLLEAPADRHSRLLASMLRDPQRLLSYLLMLLHDPQHDALAGGDGNGGRWLRSALGSGWNDLPLLELLLRAVERSPERLDHIERLLRDLADERTDLLPAEFDSVWEPIWKYRQEERR